MKSNYGFTLIEVLVAMAIFAVSSMAVLNATGQNLSTLGILEEKTLAAIVADNQMALLLLNDSAPTSEKNGNSKMGGRDWFWTIKPVDTSDGLLRALDVIVWQDEFKRNPLLTVRTYVAAK